MLFVYYLCLAYIVLAFYRNECLKQNVVLKSGPKKPENPDRSFFQS